MKTIYSLPEPKDEGLIKYINGQLKLMKINPISMRTKPNKNEVHICDSTDVKIAQRTKLVEGFINDYKKQQEEKCNITTVPLPDDEMRRIVMGTKGATINSIAKKTGTDIKIQGKAAHIRGELSKRKEAEKDIKDIINKIESTEGKTKVNVPREVMGGVIGKGRFRLKQISGETHALLQVINDSIYVSGDEMECKKAILQVKNNASDMMHYNLNKQYSCDTFDFVDATGPKCDFELQPSECPNQKWKKDQSYFKIKKVEEERGEEVSDGEINIEELKTLFTTVLKTIKKEHVSKVPKADLWCHFGHIFVAGKVDEVDQEKPISLDDFQNHFNIIKKDDWKMMFDPAVQDMEIKNLEEALSPESITVPDHIRYDLIYLTPSCLKIRIKFFLTLDGKLSNMEFSQEDIDIREDSSTSPYLLCDDFYHRAKVSVAIPSRTMDVRMTLRTVLPRKQDDKEKEYEKILKKYLDKIEVKDGNIVFPDDPLPEDFHLQFYRKCKRRSYQYNRGEDSFSMTLSEEEELNVLDNVGEVGKTKTDIHLHCDEWDRLLTSGNWEPEEIVAKLPIFLSVLREVQENISAPGNDE